MSKKDVVVRTWQCDLPPDELGRRFIAMPDTFFREYTEVYIDTVNKPSMIVYGPNDEGSRRNYRGLRRVGPPDNGLDQHFHSIGFKEGDQFQITVECCDNQFWVQKPREEEEK